MENIGLNEVFNKVKEFHKAFGHPIVETPTVMDISRAFKRSDWIEQEVGEFLIAAEDKDLVEQADAMIDIIYFAIGTLVELGVEPQRLFDIVHQANMNKLWPDGKPRLQPDGKVMKPENWVDPHELIKAEIENQTKLNNKILNKEGE
jgi:predicted HAD superfamily Cof-like phosphohydrolase